jgi:CheY-like chemotaxis protein
MVLFGHENELMSSCSTILVADDDQNDVFFLRRAFQKSGLGHSVAHVPDGQEAIDYLRGEGDYSDRKRFPLPTLLLLDLKMPKVDGFDVLTWLKSQPAWQSLPVVVLSSSSREDDIQRARALGADDYRVKPADFDDLLALAQDVAARWLNAPELSR